MQAYDFEKVSKWILFWGTLFLVGIGNVSAQCFNFPNGWGSLSGPYDACPGQPIGIDYTPPSSPPITVQWNVVGGGAILSGQGTYNVVVSFPNQTPNCNVPVLPTYVTAELHCNGQWVNSLRWELCVKSIPQQFLTIRGPDTVAQGQLANYDYCEDPGPLFAIGFFATYWDPGDCGSMSNMFSVTYDPSPNCFWHGGFSAKWDSPGTKLMKVVMQKGNSAFFCHDTIYKTVTVLPSSAPVDLGNDTLIQFGDSLVLQAPAGYSNPVWQDGSIANTQLVTCPGTYWVTGTRCGSPVSDTIVVFGASFPSVSLLFDTTSCTANNYLQANPLPLFAQPANLSNLTWSTGSSNDSILITSSGTYWVQAIDSSGCISSDTLHLIHTADPVSLPQDTIVCNLPIVLTPSPNAFVSYNWSTGSSTDTTLADSSGTYWVETTDSFGCDTRDSITVTQFIGPSLDIASDTICEFPYFAQSGSSGFSNILWSTGATGDSLLVTAPGTYWVDALDTNACSSTDTFNVAQHPAISVILPSDTVCDLPYLLQPPSSDFAGLVWSDGSTADSLLVTSPGTYWVQAVDTNGCTSSDTSIIAQYLISDMGLPLDTTVCEIPFQFTTGASGFQSITWSTGWVGNSTWIPSPGSYWVNSVDNNGCESIDTIQISAVPAPSISLMSTPSTNQNGTISVTATGGLSPFLYSIDSLSFQASGAFSGLSPGLYTIFIQDSAGCIFQDTITVGLATGIDQPFDHQVTVFPNPTMGKLTLVSESSPLKHIDLYTPTGKLAFRTEIAPGVWRCSLDLENFLDGFYFMLIGLEGEIVWRRISIVK